MLLAARIAPSISHDLRLCTRFFGLSRRSAVAVLIAFIGALAGPAWALDWQVTRLEVAATDPSKTEVAIGMNAPELAGDLAAQQALERRGVKAQYFVLPPDGSQPHRLVVDIPKAGWQVPSAALASQAGLVDGFRFGQFSPSITRFVFELSQQSRVSDLQAVLWQGRVELRLSLLPSAKQQTAKMHTVVARPPAAPSAGRTAPFLDASASPLGQLLVKASASLEGLGQPSGLLAPKPQSKPKTIARRSLPVRGQRPDVQASQQQAVVVPSGILLPSGQRVPAIKPDLNTTGLRGSYQQVKPVIVIDPGHGGKDPGTRSRRGLLEKDVTLAFAKALYGRLKASGRYQVYLSRGEDRAISLADRRSMGAAVKADLFLSIHADFVEAGGVSGATIYTLSQEASDPEALASARRENGPDGLHASLSSDPEAAQELLSMGFQSQKNEADFAAKLLVDHLRSQWPLHKKPHKSAGFKVLKSPDVPSLLIEVGYMSNREDLALMVSPFEHRRFAALIEKGLNDYFAR